MRVAITSLLFVLAPALRAQTTQAIRVDARCVDPDGKPVAGVTLADRWSEVDGHWQWSFECPTPEHPLNLISDQDGRVRGTWVLSPFATPLLAWSADHALAAFVAPSFDPLTHEGVVVGDLRMQRTTEVHAEIRSLSASPACRFGLIWNARDAEGNQRSMHCFLGLDRRKVDVDDITEGASGMRGDANGGGALLEPQPLVLGGVEEVGGNIGHGKLRKGCVRQR